MLAQSGLLGVWPPQYLAGHHAPRQVASGSGGGHVAIWIEVNGLLSFCFLICLQEAKGSPPGTGLVVAPVPACVGLHPIQSISL